MLDGWAGVLAGNAAEERTGQRLIAQLSACEVAALSFCRLLERWARGEADPSTPGRRQAALRRAAERAETALAGLERPLGRYLLELQTDHAEGRSWYGEPGAGELRDWQDVLDRAGVSVSAVRVAQTYLELAVLVRALEGLARRRGHGLRARPLGRSGRASSTCARTSSAARSKTSARSPPDLAVSAPSIAVVGSINLDLVARCARLPRPGETLTDATFERVPGGKGANQALAAARLGARVAMTGAVGRDPFAGEALALLDEGGVDLSGVRETERHRRRADRGRAPTARTRSSSRPGRTRSVEAGEGLGDADAVLCQLEIPVETVSAAAGQARFLCLNAAPAKPLPPELLAEVDLLVVNRYELEAIGAARRPDRADARRRRGRPPRRRAGDRPRSPAAGGSRRRHGRRRCLHRVPARLAPRGPARARRRSPAPAPPGRSPRHARARSLPCPPRPR